MNLTKRITPNKNTSRNGWKPDMIVCHITEGSYSGAVEWLCNPQSSASAHFVVARDGRITQLVEITDTAWGNGTYTDPRSSKYYGHSSLAAVRERKTNANSYTISIEHEGFTKDTQGALTDAQLTATVELIKHIRSEVKRLYGTDIPADRQHVVGHCDVTPKWKPGCPGAKYPFDEVIRRVNGGAASQPTNANPTLRRGDKGQAVADMQALLNAALMGTGITPLAVDGSFGAATEAAVKAFQKAQGHPLDGVCGSLTWSALLVNDSTNDSVGISLINPPTATMEQAEAWARVEGATETFISLARLYWDLAPMCGGINPAIGYVQSALETGYGKFNGVVPESHYNPCGMKTHDGTDCSDPAHHQVFPDWAAGVMAHLDHSALYAGVLGYPLSYTTDPRHFPYLHGTGKTIETMAAGWCPGNPNYAESIKKLMARLEATPVSGKTAAEATVDNMLADGVITDRTYWLGFLTGNTTAKLEYIITVLNQYHDKLVGQLK